MFGVEVCQSLPVSLSVQYYAIEELISLADGRTAHIHNTRSQTCYILYVRVLYIYDVQQTDQL